jgi:hypothetical protein
MTGRVPGKICKNGITKLLSLDITSSMRLASKNLWIRVVN